MNTRIVAIRAGAMAKNIVTILFFPNGEMSHPLSGEVGLNSLGIVNFRVLRPMYVSSADAIKIAIITEKSLNNCLICLTKSKVKIFIKEFQIKIKIVLLMEGMVYFGMI
jgi:hypothetical protein